MRLVYFLAIAIASGAYAGAPAPPDASSADSMDPSSSNKGISEYQPLTKCAGMRQHKALASWNGSNGYATWPQGVIPYLLDDSFPTFMKDRIRDGMRVLSNRTCLRFVDVEERLYTLKNTTTTLAIKEFVHNLRAKETEGKSSTSQKSRNVEMPLKLPKHFLAILYYPPFDFFCASLGVGMNSNTLLNDSQMDPNIMFLSRSCDSSTIVHELLHVAGFDHEMTRRDRDAFVNVDELPWYMPERYQYEKRENSRDLFGYDYYSIMHYGDNAVQYGGKPILSAPVEVIDHSYLRASDQAAVNFIYGCALEKSPRIKAKGDQWVHSYNPPLRCVSSVSSPETLLGKPVQNPRVLLRPGVPFSVSFTAMKAETTPSEDFTYTVTPPYVKGSSQSLSEILEISIQEEKKELSLFARVINYVFGEGTIQPPTFIGSSMAVQLHFLSHSGFARLLSTRPSFANVTASMDVEFRLRSTGETVKSCIDIEFVDDQSTDIDPVCFGESGRSGCSFHGICTSYQQNSRRCGYCVCDEGWKGERCQFPSHSQCSGSYAVRFNSEMDMSILFPPNRTTATHSSQRAKQLDALTFYENMASPFSRSTLDGKRGGVSISSGLTVYLRSLINKKEHPGKRIAPGRITLSMVLPLGSSQTEIFLSSSTNPNIRFRIPIDQSSISTRSFPFIELQESLPEPNCYCFFDISPNYDRGDLSVRINGDVAWMTIFADENNHFHPEVEHSIAQVDGSPMMELDTIEIAHHGAKSSGPCFLEEVTVECRVSIQPRLTLRNEVIVHDENSSFLLGAPTPDQESFQNRISVVGIFPEEHHDSIITYETGMFTVSSVPTTRRESAGPRRASSSQVKLVYAVSSKMVNASMKDQFATPQREVNYAIIFVNKNILERDDLAAPIVFANRVGKHRGHAYTFDIATDARTCFISDITKRSITKRVGKNSPRENGGALVFEPSDDVYVETLPTPINLSNSVSFSFRLPEDGSGLRTNMYISPQHAVYAKDLFTFAVHLQGRGTKYETLEMRISLVESRHFQVLCLRKADGVFTVGDVIHSYLVVPYYDAPEESIRGGVWHTVVVQAGQGLQEEATITVYRDADEKILMHRTISYGNRPNGFLCNVRAFSVSAPRTALELTEVYISHASQAQRIVHHTDGKDGDRVSEIEAMLSGARYYHDSTFQVPSTGDHAFAIQAGARPFVRVRDGVLEHAVASIDGVYAHNREISRRRCKEVAGHRVCQKMPTPDVLCYIDPSKKFRPYKVEGNLVCRNNTRFQWWLGEERILSDVLKNAHDDCMRAFQGDSMLKSLSGSLDRVHQDVSTMSSAEKELFLELPTGVRDMTASRALRRLKRLSAVKSTLLAHPQVPIEPKGGFFASLQSAARWLIGSAPPIENIREGQTARRKESGERFPTVLTKSIISSNWWNAVDDCQFFYTEALPVMQAVMTRAENVKKTFSLQAAFDQLEQSFLLFRQKLLSERNRLVKEQLLLKRQPMTALNPVQEALLVEYDNFLMGIQQHQSPSGVLVDLTASFTGDPRRTHAELFGSESLCHNSSKSPAQLQRDVDWVASVLVNAWEWNRLAFRFWDIWTEEFYTR
ncbi:M12A family peptidase [Perkinsela sp. CCAP 1560/4]|nr:M12A family peptidase [Perkinsela sp. CCAP 1560/4]|eukprot:KNH03731.1 M12A family peptidase [Perkinsela sp. CCAP 1560/4]